jgi:hypothetical protein
MTHRTMPITFRPTTGGFRIYAVTSAFPAVRESMGWTHSGPGDQMWDMDVWRRIEDRGYVARISGSGQWANRGDHGVYIGTGATAEAAAHAAWYSRWEDDDDDQYGYPDLPAPLLAAARDHDAVACPAPVVE